MRKGSAPECLRGQKFFLKNDPMHSTRLLVVGVRPTSLFAYAEVSEWPSVSGIAAAPRTTWLEAAKAKLARKALLDEGLTVKKTGYNILLMAG
jgi:hypothetical protein